MQAKLEPAEFAYLLHTLEAQKVAGVNNAQLFPADTSARDDLLSRGFSQLQAHGWFVAANGQISANSRLMLLAAAIANPDYVLTATYYAQDDTRQTITYYIAAELVVEQFLTIEGDYLLTQLPVQTALVERLAEIYSLPKSAMRPFPLLKFELKTFEMARSQAKRGFPAALRQAIQANDVSPDALDDLVKTISGLQPAGKIEGAALAGQHLLAWHELALLHDSAGQPWLAYKDDEETLLELTPADHDRFERFLRQYHLPKFD